VCAGRSCIIVSLAMASCVFAQEPQGPDLAGPAETTEGPQRGADLLLPRVPEGAKPEMVVLPLLQHDERVVAIAFSPDGQAVVSMDRGEKAIVWHVPSGVPRQEVDVGTRLRTMSFRDWARRFALPGEGLSEVSSGRAVEPGREGWLRAPPPDATEEAVPGGIPGLSGTGPVAVSPDGTLVAAEVDRYSVLLWDATTGRARARLEAGMRPGFGTLAAAADRLLLACGDRFWTLDVARGTLDHEPVAEMPRNTVRAPFALSPDGCTLAVGSRRGAHVYDLTSVTGSRLASGREVGPRRPIDVIGFSRDGDELICASGRGESALLLWRASISAESSTAAVRLAALNGGDDWLIATDSGYYDCSLDAGRNIAWRIGPHIYPFDQFEEVFHRPDLVRRALAGDALDGATRLSASLLPPEVRFLAPEYNAEVAGDQVNVVIEVKGHRPLERVEVTVDGRPISNDDMEGLETTQPGENQARYSFGLPLARGRSRLRLRAVAYDELLLRSRPAEVVVRVGGQSAESGELRLVAVGVSEYQDNTLWSDLRYAHRDALAFARAALGSEEQAYVDQKATISTVKFALRELKDTATEADMAVVFLAGHGVVDDRGEYYFLVHDSKPDDLPNTALPWSDFVSVLRDVRAHRIILFVDTCRAGTVTGPDTMDALIDRLNTEAGVAVFSACRGNEDSVEDAALGHGAFTQALLEAFAGRADADADHYVSLEELKFYVIPRVRELTGGTQRPYFPRLTDFAPEEVIGAVP